MIIGLHGKMGSGKSTIANKIVAVHQDQHNIKAEIKSFAQPIYKLTSILFDESIENIKQAKHSIFRTRNYSLRSYRELLQTIGMELRDNVDIDIWIDALFGKGNSKILQDWTGGLKWWIIDDLRFLNELKRIKQNGGKIIKIFRDTPDLHQDFWKNVQNNESEIQLDTLDNSKWDLIIDNNNPLNVSTNIVANFIATLLTNVEK